MKRLALVVVAGFAACPNSAPDLAGEFLGSFFFTGQMVAAGDGGTTCLVDGGVLNFPATVSFYAQLSLVDGGPGMWWQLQNALPVEGVEAAGTFSEATSVVALVSGCNCAAALEETVTLTSDAGAFSPGLPWLGGTVDDRLDPTPELDAGAVCGSVDAGVASGAGCNLGCDLIYQVIGVPQEPSGGY